MWNELWKRPRTAGNDKVAGTPALRALLEGPAITQGDYDAPSKKITELETLKQMYKVTVGEINTKGNVLRLQK